MYLETFWLIRFVGKILPYPLILTTRYCTNAIICQLSRYFVQVFRYKEIPACYLSLEITWNSHLASQLAHDFAFKLFLLAKIIDILMNYTTRRYFLNVLYYVPPPPPHTKDWYWTMVCITHIVKPSGLFLPQCHCQAVTSEGSSSSSPAHHPLQQRRYCNYHPLGSFSIWQT